MQKNKFGLNMNWNLIIKNVLGINYFTLKKIQKLNLPFNNPGNYGFSKSQRNL